MRRGCAVRTALAVPLALALLPAGSSANAADKPDSCIAVARIVSIQGVLQIQRTGQKQWSYVRKLDTALCQGDVLHAGPRSRAALVISPETLVRLDQSSTLAVSQTQDETIVEFSKDPGLFQPVLTAPNPCGAGYFITRFPRKFRVLTPFINASVEGTEFLVAMRCESAQVAVFEGRVLAQELLSASSRAFSLKEGEALEAGSTQPAAVTLIIEPVDAVQWALYYPPITEPAGEAAADQNCDQRDAAARSVCIVQRAEQRLRSGRVEEAEADIQMLLNVGLGDGDAYALLSIISLVKNDKAKALELAGHATQLSPSSSRTWLALSYAQQASFELENALAAAKKAAALAPGSSLAQARVAELLMSLGRIGEAETTAAAAVKNNPNDSRAHMVRGFVHLAQIDTKKARQDFLAAIELDSTDPLPRLGLGLATIRDGDLQAGREQIEIAVVLDPTNSLLRSYLGKAYYEEYTKQREALAATQFGIAKRLDPRDPTPWFYDAVLKQATNRSGEALQDMQESMELNGNRAVYRSRLLLDEDQAARSANLAQIYQDLSFDQLSVHTGMQSLAIDPASFSAHRFLADSYLTEPRLGSARVSELLQSELLQPANLNTAQPQLGEQQLLILARTGPRAGFEEYTALFDRNRFQLLGSAVAGNNDTWGDELVASALHGGLSVSFGQFHYQTAGSQPNDDYTTNLYTAFLQNDVTYSTSFQLEARATRSELGDIVRSFDPLDFSPNRRIEEDSDTGRVGLRHTIGASHVLLASVSYEDRQKNDFDRQVENVPGLPLPVNGDTQLTSSAQSWLGELQYLFRGQRLSVVAGAGYLGQPFKTQFDILATLTDGTVLNQQSELFDTASRYRNAYVYSTFSAMPTLQLTGALSVDNFKQGFWYENAQWNPKIGLVWRALPGTAVRAAWFKYLKRGLAGLGTLEPTQFAGFNQLYDEPAGTDSESWGVGVDQQLWRRLFAGAEVLQRRLVIPIAPEVGTTAPASLQSWKEDLARAYIGFLLTPQIALSAQYYYELQERTEVDSTTLSNPTRLRTQIAPLTISYLHPSGIFGLVRANYVEQVIGTPVAGVLEEQGDSFWTVDLSLGYRLLPYKAAISLNVKNLFDEQFRFRDTNLNDVARPPLFRSGRYFWIAANFQI